MEQWEWGLCRAGTWGGLQREGCKVAQVHRVRFSRPPQQELPEVRGQVTYGLKDRAHRLDMAEDAKAELEKYFKERVFTFVHHYSGEVDNLGKAVEEVAAEQGVR